MEQEDRWIRFASTGRIQDYLDYRCLENVSAAGEKSSYCGGESGRSDLEQRKQKEKK